MIEIQNWSKLDNLNLSANDKLYRIYTLENGTNSFWEEDKKQIDYSILLEDISENNVYSANLMIREVNWCIGGIEIKLEVVSLKGIKKSFYLAREDIKDFYGFINLLSGLVEKIDNEIQSIEKKVTLLKSTL